MHVGILLSQVVLSNLDDLYIAQLILLKVDTINKQILLIINLALLIDFQGIEDHKTQQIMNDQLVQPGDILTLGQKVSIVVRRK